MTPIRLLRHTSGAPGLRWFGIGPAGRPTRGLLKLQRLLDKHTLWVKDRSLSDLKKEICQGPQVFKKRYVNHCGGGGEGALLNHSKLLKTERNYLMTANNAGFNEQQRFDIASNQQQLVLLESSG